MPIQRTPAPRPISKIKAEMRTWLRNFTSYPILLDRMMRMGPHPSRRSVELNSIWDFESRKVLVRGQVILEHARALKAEDIRNFTPFNIKPLKRFVRN